MCSRVLMPLRTIAVCVLATLYLQGCVINPATGRPDLVFMSEEKEIALGEENHRKILQQLPVYNDPALQDYVNTVGQRVATKSDRPGLEYTFTIIDSPDVNAFALPGGYIYINRGLMAYMETEAQLAAVLGHEIGHVTARHAVRQHRNSVLANTAGIAVAIGTGIGAAGQVANVAGQAAVSGYGRDLELEADRLGARYMAESGYDHQEMLKVLGILKYQQEYAQARARAEGRETAAYHGVFSSHPENDERLQGVVREAKKLESKADPVVGRNAFLQQTDGMVYGSNREQGVSRGNAFYHETLGFAFNIPDTWLVENQANAILLFAPQGAASIKIGTLAQPGGLAPQELLERLKVPGLSNSRALTVHGLPAATADARGARKVATVYYRGQAYVFIGEPKAGEAPPAGYTQDFEQVVTSFHQLTPVEAGKAEPWRIKTWTAKPGLSYDTLAKISPLGSDAEAQLRLINQHYPKGEMQAGETVKLIE